jgi:hypothetical protein
MNIKHLIEVVQWAAKPITRHNLTNTTNIQLLRNAAKQEKAWATTITSDTATWSGKLGENTVKELLKLNGHRVWKPKKRQGMHPDWETDHAVWEVKTRNWSVPGTIGEKLLGVPYKYSDVPDAYGKPLKVVCLAYQEWECTHVKKMNIFGADVSREKQRQLELWKHQGIEFIPFSKILPLL